MNGSGHDRKRLLVEPIVVWLVLIALFAASTASAYVPLGALNTALNPAIGAVMVVLLVIFLMDLRHASRLIHVMAVAGLFWTIFMFALTFADYASRHY